MERCEEKGRLETRCAVSMNFVCTCKVLGSYANVTMLLDASYCQLIGLINN